MTVLSRASRKIGDKFNPLLAPLRRTRLERTDFTVISNNCWAGSVYRRYGLPYLSPTAGLYFFADDYVRFAASLRHYTEARLEFIDALDSRHADLLREKGELGKIVGKVDDVEIVFLHYPTKEVAFEKWQRRCERINWNNLFIKFSEMNNCTGEELQAFNAIPFKSKICFTSVPYPELDCAIYCPGFESSEGCILNDTDCYAKYIDLEKWLNGSHEPYDLG